MIALIYFKRILLRPIGKNSHVVHGGIRDFKACHKFLALTTRTRQVKEGTGTSAGVSEAFGPAGSIHLGNSGFYILWFSVMIAAGFSRIKLHSGKRFDRSGLYIKKAEVLSISQ
jgi:hypothetical protein